jgi:hypothetical protein
VLSPGTSYAVKTIAPGYTIEWHDDSPTYSGSTQHLFTGDPPLTIDPTLAPSP